MADITVPPAPSTPATPAEPAAPQPPPIPTAPSMERISIPASAVFDDGELDVEAPVTPTTPAVTPPPVTPPVETLTVTPPAAPVTPTVPVTPEPPKPDTKIKIGDKEYTTAELEAELAKRKETPVQPPAPSTAAPAPTAPVVPPPTKEEIAARESKWVSDFATTNKFNLAPTSEEVETLLSGGEDAIKLLDKKLNEAVAVAVMQTRKSMWGELNQEFHSIRQQVAPLYEQARSVEYASAEAQFLSIHPEFKEDMDVARAIGQELLARYPEQTAKMTQEQLIAEVAGQTSQYLQDQYKRFNPGSTNTWKDARKAKEVPVTSPVVVPPAAPVIPQIVPPSSNAPAATAAVPNAASFAKTTAKDLQD